MRRIVMTGATGFIGRQLLKKLAAGPNEVVAIVRAKDNEHARQRLRDLAYQQNVKPVAGDIRSPGLGVDAAIFEEADAFIHCAAEAKLGQRDEQRLREIHVDAVRRIALLCQHHKIKRLIHFSTAYVAPGGDGTVLTMKSSIKRGCNAYERTKAQGEHVLLNETLGSVDIVRPGIVLPAMEFIEDTLTASPVGQFLSQLQLLRNQAWSVPGREDLRLGFVRVEDVVDFVQALLIREGLGINVWNLVFKGPTTGKLREEFRYITGLNPPPLSDHYPRLLSPWAPYLLRERSWDTSETTAVAEEMRVRISPPDHEVFRRIFHAWFRLHSMKDVA